MTTWGCSGIFGATSDDLPETPLGPAMRVPVLCLALALFAGTHAHLLYSDARMCAQSVPSLPMRMLPAVVLQVRR